ncbi:MAG: hypothetical protein BroJett030_26300 [Alphaproteobacteria bacterium]|nr:MAG: hypothetical protein BroJett030_26300 [Alphaproteobacteria bacterium]
MPTLHVAFLRGIGPARKAPGAELRACFGAAGYDPVIPVLATGNVVFGAGADHAAPTADAVETLLERHFGYAIAVVMRSSTQIADMFAATPFADVDAAKYHRFVTLTRDGRLPKELPEPPAGSDFRIVGRLKGNLFVIRDNRAVGTPQMMAFIERALGGIVTTRNWNTMEKIAALLPGANPSR